ncbi:hypothetical protein I316_03152 [Kwoniella heveanensis BCC8398]|uniref:C3H1-type domain-containing protein n=1 Tax=Kwoniella heveanensis BCC8398 TaxID=1296120 RepID=A0A1B9GVR1_9TREE|nr:hypothetical protein I316_03152 [Kwoniella heveanensis BCC8398]
MPSSSLSTPSSPSSTHSLVSRAGSITSPARGQPARSEHEHEQSEQQRQGPSIDLIDLVDLATPPWSPRTRLRRILPASASPTPSAYGTSHMDDMRSLIDGDVSDGDEDDDGAQGDDEGAHLPAYRSNTVSSINHGVDMAYRESHETEDSDEDDEDDIQATPRPSPEPAEADDEIAIEPDDQDDDQPDAKRASQETPIANSAVMTRAPGDDSASTRSHLSAHASPFRFVERPRTISVTRSATPPSFFSNREQPSRSFQENRPYVSHSSPVQRKLLSEPVRLPSHGPIGFGMASSVPMQQSHSLPAYPYTFSSPWVSKGAHPQAEENSVGSTFLSRESKAIKIISPEMSKQSPPPPVPKEVVVVQEPKPSVPKRSQNVAVSSTSEGPKLYHRRGKDEILQLYSQSSTDQNSTVNRSVTMPLASPHVAPHMVPLPVTPIRSKALSISVIEDGPPRDAAQGQMIAMKPLLTPPLSAHGDGNELDEILGHLKELGALWSDHQGAQTRFAEGFKLLLDTLKQSATSHTCIETASSADKSALIEMQTELRAVREENAKLSGSVQAYQGALNDANYESAEAFKETVKLKAENQVLKESFREITLQCSRLETTAAHMCKRKDELKKTLRALSARAASEYGSIRQAQFDPDLLEQARDGDLIGQELAQRLIHTAQQATAVHFPGEDIPFLTGILFVDVAGLVEGFGQFRDFCDGFNSSSSLLSLVDTDGPEGAADKVRDEKTEGTSKLYAIRSTDEIETDPYIDLGKDRLVLVKGMFSIDPSVWYRQFGRVSGALTVSEASGSVAGRSPSQTRESSPASAATIRGRPPPPVGPQPSLQVHPNLVPTRQHDRSSRTAPRAPWDTRKKPSIDRQPKEESRSEFKPVVDRSYKLSPLTTPKNSTVRSFTARPGSPTPRRVSHNDDMIVVPIRAGEDGSIGGSPPESDEDEPSVLLPHSALKHVQRPTVIERQDPARPESPIQHGFKIRGAAAAATAASSSVLSTRGPPSVSSVSTFRDAPKPEVKDTAPWKRKTPLPMNSRVQRALGRTAGSGSNSIPLGGKAAPSPRPQPADFEYVRALDPKPCHNHYLKGSCTDSDCLFEHHYNLEISQWNVLRIFVKQLVTVPLLPEGIVQA